MTNSSTRPQGFEGRGDARLPQITRRLQRRLSDAQRQFTYDSLRLGRDALRQLAGVVVDFAEDIHNDIGIWRAYERYNVQFFGTPLPITDGHCGGPASGQEIMTHFTPLIRGLQRRGENLTEDEQLAFQSFFCAEEVSPQFVRRVLAEYGDESVRATFLLKGDLPNYWLDYLLRSHKGQFYRKRYPRRRITQ